MQQPADTPDQELSPLDDVELVRRARQESGGPAPWALVLRHLDWATGVLIHWARRPGLPRPEPEEARQEAVFGVLAAVAAYRLPSAGQPGTPFRAFLGRVLIRDLQDRARRARRAARLFVRGLPSASSLTDLRNDPGRNAERDELLASLHAGLEALGINFRQLWEQKEAGDSLRAFADERHLSNDRVKRQWEDGLRQLWERLRRYFEEAA